MNCHKILASVFAFAVCLAGSDAGADVYVDSSFEGVADGTVEKPYGTIREGCAKAGFGDRVLVRGRQEYRFRSGDDAAIVVEPSVRVLGCDGDWNPVVDCLASNDMPIVVVDKDYRGREWKSPFEIRECGCAVSGLRVQFDRGVFAGGGHREGLIAIRGNVSDTKVENCMFEMSFTAGSLYEGGTNGVVAGVYVHGTSGENSAQVKNTVIRRCAFYMGESSDTICAFFNLHAGTRFEENYVVRLGTLFAGTNQGVQNMDLNVISNVFLNCCNQVGGRKFWLFNSNGEYSPYSGEIAYNRFVRDDYDTIGYYLLQHGRQNFGNWLGETLIHHNTIVGYDLVIESPGYKGAEAPGKTWSPQIFDNLIVDTQSILSETANAKWEDGCTSSFRVGSTFKGNAVQCNGDFNVGSAKSQSWYSLANLDGWGSKKVITAPKFMNTTDPTSKNYYRLRVKDDSWVIDNAISDASWPHYIGAVVPVQRGFAVRVR